MKKQKWLRVAAVAVVLAVGALGWSLTHPAGGSNGILYHVSGGKGDMYLLGSIHIGSRAMYPFGAEIREAMAHSDTFVYECDTASDEAVSAVRARMALPAGQTLQSLIGDDLYAELRLVCEQLGLSIQQLDGLKPWSVINTLAVYSTAAELGAVNVSQALSLGVENQVQAYAEKNHRQTAYLETAVEQTDVLEGFSDSLKRYLLKTECDTILNPQSATGMDASIACWPEWWRQGNAQAFSRQYLSSYLAPGYETECLEYHTKLITERNTRMAVRLDEMLQSGGSTFVTVGLLHLVLPEDSIVARLREMGYTVEAVAMQPETSAQ